MINFIADQASLNKYCLSQDFSKIGNGICDFEVKYAACYDDAGDCDDTLGGVEINSTIGSTGSKGSKGSKGPKGPKGPKGSKSLKSLKRLKN